MLLPAYNVVMQTSPASTASAVLLIRETTAAAAVAGMLLGTGLPFLTMQ